MKRILLFLAVGILFATVAYANHLNIAPTGLSASISGNNVTLNWTQYDSNNFPSDCTSNREIQIFRDGVTIFAVDKNQTSYVDEELPVGTYSYNIRAKCRVPAVPGVSSASNHFSPFSNTVTAIIAVASCSEAPVVEASASPTILWPPNSKLVAVTVSGVVTAGSGCYLPEEVSYSIYDDYEELSITGTAPITAGGDFSFIVNLEASRLGSDLDGRLYTIEVIASEDVYESEPAEVFVIVPHDQRKK